MTKLAPVNARATVPAVFDPSTFDRDKVPAGHWHYYVREQGGPPAGMLFGCPCGCGEMHSIGFRPAETQRPSWEFNGSETAPTLTPSVNILQFNDAGVQIGEHWHGWLTDGVWKHC